MREERTDVLVVGAGPVGLTAALLLAEAGIKVRIIDRESRTAARSYACALHPRVLSLLARLGLRDDLISRGRKIGKMVFYDQAERKAELNVSSLGGEHPYVLVLTQDVVEELLEEQLRSKGVNVEWNHRFDSFQTKQDGLVAAVEKLGGTSTGYIVPHWETVVERRFNVMTNFVIGADGVRSIVSQRLGAEYGIIGGPEFFAAYEFEADAPTENEISVVLDDNTTDVLWPLPGNKHRWTFQLVKSEVSREFPDKERRAIHVEHQKPDNATREYLEQVFNNRAPWFKRRVKEVEWGTDVCFEHRLAKQFGKGRCWLVGDAAHQTGPVGAQSMNIGMLEAESLVNKIKAVIKNGGGVGSLDLYNAERQQEWAPLLGFTAGLQPRKDTKEWVRRRAERLLSCLPASGADLAKLSDQLGLQYALAGS